ncbi:MAG: gamma carbonic anhydrase family protein [Rhodospirillales bacterium]|nr:gamma carbonic anhydrase family protein [Rhodospirillales bacterium]MCB9973522.1 gamma carbonic anhydrase family protein [Rhodospirillales bacterium]MCB9980682.1 gamma carbonic anhydrase family protein [Rhodospirillales bacterium]
MSFILPYKNIRPKISDKAFIAPTAAIIGDVDIGEGTGVWFGCSVRGDVNDIRIGKRTNIQDGSVIHVTRNVQGTYIGDEVTIGHMALLHACTIEDRAFIGMGAIVMDEAVVETYGMLAAGAMLTPGRRVLSGQLWAGRPAKYWRDLTQEERDFIPVSAENYARHVTEYLAEMP